MERQEILNALQNGETALGIELGSTRIKAVLISTRGVCFATGEYLWENRLEDGYWTYSLCEVWQGLHACYQMLAADVRQRYSIPLTTVGSIGISGMMHGYLPFDNAGSLLIPFRTWRNTTTERAAKELTGLFGFNVPQRWSIAHLYQAILDDEVHVKKIDFMTTLAGYVHWTLTGERQCGIGEASGMFPIDSVSHAYDEVMLSKFQALIAEKKYGWKVSDILPTILPAGQRAGTLTKEGAALLDPTGVLQSGIPFCPPEGDAGAGMVATNAVAERTGNVSAGTSIFAMIVLEHPLSQVYEEIDMVATPTGKQVAMVHCNNCTNEINAWVSLFREMVESLGFTISADQLYATLFQRALEGEPDGGGLLGYNYLSGEPITCFSEGRPLLMRSPGSCFSLANFMRTQLYSCVATLSIGMEILKREQVQVDKLVSHGGFFKIPLVGQRIMAAATGTTVGVMATAGEGGPWGMAILAAYLQEHRTLTLEKFLEEKIFATASCVDVAPDRDEMIGFQNYMSRYKRGLAVERAALEL